VEAVSHEPKPILITHSTNIGDYEPATDLCISGPIPSSRYLPSGGYAGSIGEPIREREWEIDPDRPGQRRMARDPETGRITPSIPFYLRKTIALGKAAEHLASIKPQRITVQVKRTQIIEVEVDSAYTSMEATHVALQAASQGFTDEQWSKGTCSYQSGFHNASVEGPAPLTVGRIF
jgi:hypothetical protein